MLWFKRIRSTKSRLTRSSINNLWAVFHTFLSRSRRFVCLSYFVQNWWAHLNSWGVPMLLKGIYSLILVDLMKVTRYLFHINDPSFILNKYRVTLQTMSTEICLCIVLDVELWDVSQLSFLFKLNTYLFFSNLSIRT